MSHSLRPPVAAPLQPPVPTPMPTPVPAPVPAQTAAHKATRSPAPSEIDDLTPERLAAARFAGAAVVAVMLLLAALLTGCGGGGGGGTGAEAPASPVGVPVPSPTPVPAPAPAPAPAVTAVGAPLGPVAASARIGPAGGRLDAPDYGLSVIVPPGAFVVEQTVTLQPIENKAPGGRGPAWRIRPEGVVAARPITLEWQPNGAQRNGARHLRIATQGADGVWRSAAEDIEVDGVVRRTTHHFSDWSLVAGYQIVPGTAELALGAELQLLVQACHRAVDPVEPGQMRHFACENLPFASLDAAGWAVNGLPLGSAEVGTLTVPPLDAARARYRAPAAVPARNPVAVSVNYTDSQTPRPLTQQLVAHIQLLDDQPGCQWLGSVGALQLELEQDFRGAYRGDTSESSFNHSARVAALLQRDPGTPIGQAWFSGSADSGLVNAEQQHRFSDASIEVTGHGLPLAGPGLPPQIRVFVDFGTCRLMLAGHVGTPARHVMTDAQGSRLLEPARSGLNFAVADAQVGGRGAMAQDRLVPVPLHGSTDGLLAYVYPDSHASYPGAIGQARLSWRLTPR